MTHTQTLLARVLCAALALAPVASGAPAQGPGASPQQGGPTMRPVPTGPSRVPMPAPAPLPGIPGPAPSAVIVPVQPWERISISLTTSRLTYEVGQPISFRVGVSRDCYIYLFSTDAAGVTRQLFPNCYDTDNYVRARRTYTIPDRGDYQIVASEPAGPDRIHLVATTEYYDWMDQRYRVSSGSEPFPAVLGGGQTLADGLRREEQRGPGRQSRQVVPPNAPPDYNTNARVEVVPVHRPAWGERFLTLTIRRPSGYPYPPQPPSFWDGQPQPPPPPGQVVESGTLVVRTTPSGADITIGNVYYGRAPLELRLPPGTYDILAERRGYEPELERVRVRAGTRQTVKLTLDRD